MRSKSSDKERSILEAAVKVFAKKGFFRSKVSEIAREAGVADGTIYNYYRNKDDLLISIFEVKMQEIVSRFRDVIAESQNDDAASRLKLLIGMHLGGFQAHPDLAAVFQVELRRSSRFMREYKKIELRRYMDIIGDIVEQGQREGTFRRDLPLGLVKRFVFGTLDEVVSTWVLSRKRYDLQALSDSIMDLFLRGIRREAPPPQGGKGRGDQGKERHETACG